MFLREASRVRNRWILDASNIRPPVGRGLRCSKNLILLMFLAPRPGLEPGTYGLTVDRSIYPQTGMNAVPSGFSYPISLACFTQPRPEAAIPETLDIGSLGWLVAHSCKGITMRS